MLKNSQICENSIKKTINQNQNIIFISFNSCNSYIYLGSKYSKLSDRVEMQGILNLSF